MLQKGLKYDENKISPRPGLNCNPLFKPPFTGAFSSISKNGAPVPFWDGVPTLLEKVSKIIDNSNYKNNYFFERGKKRGFKK